MTPLSSLGLLPDGQDLAWLVLALLCLAGLVQGWRKKDRHTQTKLAAKANNTAPDQYKRRKQQHWWAALARQLYWLISFLVLVCLLASWRLPLMLTEQLGGATASPLTLIWGDLAIANPSCALAGSMPASPDTATGISEAQRHQLCATPFGLTRKLSPYHQQPQLAPTVFENGRGLWGLRSAEILVKEQGFGRFHLPYADAAQASVANHETPATIWYSATDGSAPSTNGRTYQLRYPVEIALWVQLLGWLFCLPQLVLLARRLLASFGSGSALERQPGILLQTLFFSLLVLLCLGPLWQIWAEAGSRFAIAGVLPWSDGSAWFNGINHLLSFNELDSWTVRRPLNPVFLSSLFHLTALDWPLTLVVRALLLAASFAFLCRVLIDQFGVLPALAAVAVAGAFAQDFIPVALSETQGLIFAATGFAWLLVGITQTRLWCYALGVTLVSLALTLRLGPVGLIGAFVLWPLWSIEKAQRWHWLRITILAIAIGFAPTWLWTSAFYAGENLPGANFAYTFYGLAYGGAPWTLFAEHYPQLANLEDSKVTRLVWQQALAKVQAEPMLLLQGFASFFVNYFRYFFVYFDGTLQRVMSLLFAAGALSCCFNIFGASRQPLARFALLSWFGVLATVPIIYWSLDAYRAFAVSLPLDMILVAAGARGLLRLPNLSWSTNNTSDAQSLNSDAKLGGWSVFTISLLLLISLIPLWAMQQRPPPNMATLTEVQLVDQPLAPHQSATGVCDTGEKKLILDLGHSSPLLRLSTIPTQRTWMSEINYQAFRYDPSFYHNEIAKQLHAMQPGDSLVHGFDFAARQTNAATQVWVILPYTPETNNTKPMSGLHQVCAVPFDNSMASAHYRVYRAMSWIKVI